MASVEKPIHAKTLTAAAMERRPMSRGGTVKCSLRSAAKVARPSAATTPAVPRANSGGHSRKISFITGQFSPQPDAVTARQRRPMRLDRSRASDDITRAWRQDGASSNARDALDGIRCMSARTVQV